MTYRSASEILAAHKIGVRRLGFGQTRARCPHCSDYRRFGSKIMCLAVNIGRDGVRWHCHHCGWEGGEYYERRGDDRKARGYVVERAKDTRRDRLKIRNLYG